MIGSLPVADALIAGWVLIIGAAIIVIDARSHRIPNRLSLAWTIGVLLIAVGAAVRNGYDDLLAAALTGAGMFAVGYLLAALSPSAFGFGDVKLLGSIGLALGHLDPELIVVWLLALAVATLAWLLLAPWVDRQYDRTVALRKRHIAFGPPMVIALWLTYGAVLLLAPA